VTSIALTGAFGILGLLKDFKNKRTHKVTVWGWISLTGIVVSTVFGIAAQMKESSADAAKSRVAARKADQTLLDTERALSLFEEPKITMLITTQCVQNLDLCESIMKGTGTPAPTYQISLMVLLYHTFPMQLKLMLCSDGTPRVMTYSMDAPMPASLSAVNNTPQELICFVSPDCFMGSVPFLVMETGN
jgi:hypothetical protein